MLLFLVRHAHALDGDDDAERPLSVKGEQQVRTLADFLRRSDMFQPEEMWHSSLLRSRQTAGLLARRLKLTTPLSLMPDLGPEADPRAVVRRIRAASHSVAVVG